MSYKYNTQIIICIISRIFCILFSRIFNFLYVSESFSNPKYKIVCNIYLYIYSFWWMLITYYSVMYLSSKSKNYLFIRVFSESISFFFYDKYYLFCQWMSFYPIYLLLMLHRVVKLFCKILTFRMRLFYLSYSSVRNGLH